MDFHVKTMSAGSDPKHINHSSFFFFSSLESKDLKKTTNEDGHQSRSILALRILYRELLFFMLLCSHKSLRSIANSEKYFKFILEEENCFRV